MTRSTILANLRHRDLREVEDAAIAGLALRHEPRIMEALRRTKSAAGAWSAVPGGPPNAYLTALALLALQHSGDTRPQQTIAQGLMWLQRLRPAECHWLWKWKFRLVDRQVRFDPLKYGWPWVPGTVSWVAPTALSMLALRACGIRSERLLTARAMLLDRACPGGGWNAGNSSVFGVDLEPHPDFTAMALLALADTPASQRPVVSSATAYLAKRLENCKSPYSLAWGTMALAAFGDRRAQQYRRRLEAMDVNDYWPPRILGLVALALEDPIFTFQEFPE